MQNRSKVSLRLLALAILVTVIFSGGLASAQSYDPDQRPQDPTLFEKRINKLGRGWTNLIFGWTEIPVTWDQKMKQGKPLTYLLGTAPIIGTFRAFMRTGIGIYEIFTFAGTKPHHLYGPVIEPEYIF